MAPSAAEVAAMARFLGLDVDGAPPDNLQDELAEARAEAARLLQELEKLRRGTVLERWRQRDERARAGARARADAASERYHLEQAAAHEIAAVVGSVAQELAGAAKTKQDYERLEATCEAQVKEERERADKRVAAETWRAVEEVKLLAAKEVERARKEMLETALQLHRGKGAT
jgi:hypothetical protein